LWFQRISYSNYFLISLPIGRDYEDRPRQRICLSHGKPSVTAWLKASSFNPCLIKLIPLTGRTHQLRVHAASEQGLGSPIVGDRLYGHRRSEEFPQHHNELHNLKLHAEFLSFIHPVTNEVCRLFSPASFD